MHTRLGGQLARDAMRTCLCWPHSTTAWPILFAGIASAPLWDGEQGRVCGMLSASDFIHMLQVWGAWEGWLTALARVPCDYVWVVQ